VAEFVPGRDLALAFYEEVVAPLVADVEHSAALLGTGSDVLGFDTERSTDHHWGPRLQLFVAEAEVERVQAAVLPKLPETFRGRPTRYGWDDVPVSHHVEIEALGPWFEEQLGFDPRAEIKTVDWLTTPQQLLLTMTRGPVFHDGTGELAAVREVLSWYPDDVWLWLLACQWRRIDQEEPFVGRSAEVGDDLGSRVLASRLVRDSVRLCFLFEQRYAPYSKWLGTAFRELDAFDALQPQLAAALAARDFEAREAALVCATQLLAERHNLLGVTREVATMIGRFHGRPYRVLGSGRFVDACLERVADPWLRALPLVGAIDQVTDSTDVLSYPAIARHAASLYQRTKGLP
jgi:hypothetical protein